MYGSQYLVSFCRENEDMRTENNDIIINDWQYPILMWTGDELDAIERQFQFWN